jgi:hypothetical protein
MAESFLAKFSQPPPSKKKKITDETAKDYEKNRVRMWQPKWTNDRDWLMFDAEKKVMFCSHCREFSKEKAAPFVSGTDKFKLENVKSHENSRDHKWHATCHENAQKKKQETPAGSALSKLTKAQHDRVVKLMRTAHALAKTSQPFTHFVWICQ